MNGIRTLSFLALASGCNNHEYFNVAGYAQANYSNDADVIFVIDNSTSMREEASDLALNFTSFIDTLTSEAGGAQSTNGLVDAATNFIDLNANHGRYIDYQLAITTTAVDPLLGESTALEPGEAGWLVGDPAILSKWDADVGDAFRRNILCEATYWKEDDIPADLTYECGDETDVITQQYLDCECGMGNWENNAGSKGGEGQLGTIPGVIPMCMMPALSKLGGRCAEARKRSMSKRGLSSPTASRSQKRLKHFMAFPMSVRALKVWNCTMS